MDVKTVLASAAISAVVSATVPGLINYVELQAATPGTAQTGHSNITGNSIAARFGANTTPTLARVQVNETGPLQGVRSVTSTGVAVYGQSNATTGLGAGGYFTSASAGGRAVVAEQFSTSGPGVAGLFKSNSTNGTGLWGRDLASTGTTRGVFGEVSSPAGIGMVAVNNNKNTSVEAAGPNGSFLTKGNLPRHQYTTGQAASSAPLAYGVLNAGGTIYNAGTANWTCARTATGVYEVEVTGYSISDSNSVFFATAYDAGTAQVITYENTGTGKVRFHVFALSGAATDSDFTFIAFKTNDVGVSPMPPDSERDQVRHSQKYEAQHKAYLAESRKQNAVVPFVRPDGMNVKP